MEIGPGKYSRKHWQDGFAFVWEDAFGMAEGIVARHFPEYDHFRMNDIPAEVARRIADDWRQTAARLTSMSNDEAHDALNIAATFSTRLDSEVGPNRQPIADMLAELSDVLDEFASQEDWICILGI